MNVNEDLAGKKQIASKNPRCHLLVDKGKWCLFIKLTSQNRSIGFRTKQVTTTTADTSGRGILYQRVEKGFLLAAGCRHH
ncbi:hypothetical protein T03_16640 [Trichinella britovi]|uniref:Uncharacterized protein n=1 Tax=Trichinella britovi TaxID=45882 RepID=A0A0V1DA31_TRIBR|nr:hypothetical protein T03_16640 [Trichinella britovi]